MKKLDKLFDSFTKESVFKNKFILQSNYTPEAIPHRDKEIEQVASILAPCLRLEKPSNVFLYGKTGTGKTLVAQFVKNQLLKRASKQKKSLTIIYINCKLRKVADTEYRILVEILRKLGMTQNEVEVYLTLLNSGELSVNEIGTKSGLHRQVCYDALDRLLEKGFVSYIVKNNKKFFKPLQPEKILDYLEEKKLEINSILPKLNAMFVKEKEEAQVEVIKGKNVLRTILNDIFRMIQKNKERRK